MEILASLFVVLVTWAHVLVPQANIPQVLGVQIAQNTVDETIVVSTDVVTRDATKTTMRNRRTDKVRNALDKVRNRQETARDKVSDRIENARQTLEQKRVVFQERLQGIRDERKQKITERLHDRLGQVSEKWVAHWSNTLSRLSEVLVKIDTRAAAAAEAGSDTSSVDSAIAEAKVAIARAQSAVDAQASKAYTINITDEENLSQDVRSAISVLKEDVSATKSSVKSAREAVVKALRALKGVSGSRSVDQQTNEAP